MDPSIQRVAQALKESEARFAAFMGRNPAVAWMKNAEGQYVYVNETLQQVYNISEERVLGLKDADFFPADVARELVENDRRVIESQKPLHTLETIPDPTGDVRIWQIWKFPFQDPKGDRFVGGLAFEVTDREHAQERLRRSEERYRTLVNGARDAIFSICKEGLIDSLNPAFERITGWTCGEWLNRPFLPIVMAEDQSRALQLFHQTLEGRAQPPFEMRVQGADGEPIPVEFTVTPQVSEGKVIGVFGIGRDIRERHAFEDQLRRMQRLESVGHLAAGIAHDFNNLLTVQQVHLSLLLQDQSLSESIQESLSQIQQASERAASVIQQLLVFGRKQVLHPHAVDLNELLSGLDQLLKRSIRDDIALRLELEPDLPSVRADPGQIEQVVMNLVMNACDAMPEGGHLRLRTQSKVLSGTEGAHPESRPGRYVCVSVTDTGTGIVPEIQDRLFEPFFTTKAVGKGSGLGLATAHGIVKQHMGWLDLRSQVGIGSTFYVWLPVSDAPNGPNAPPPLVQGTEKAAKQSGGTVLLVEDEEPVRQLVHRVLTLHGYQVLVANHGVDALRVWQTHSARVDLLFTDWVMPEGISGLQLARKLQQEQPDLKVVLTSGYSSETAGEEFSENQNWCFLQKPYSVGRLVEVFEQLLGNRPLKNR